eukprot:COSAG02_NODE_45976_length_352_cov_1.422925_1_plen_26_part_10
MRDVLPHETWHALDVDIMTFAHGQLL